MLNDDEIVTSVQEKSDPVDDETDEDEDINNGNSKGSSNAGTFSALDTAMEWTATAGSDVVQSGRPVFDDIFQHLWPYIGNNTVNVVFQMVKRLWLIRIEQ
ncbi:hypothetical protein TNCV_2223021 [Trichonephila clavipes]|nr:hypothetical protein TNCV_2223021 [Trichonephila clavipes]